MVTRSFGWFPMRYIITCMMHSCVPRVFQNGAEKPKFRTRDVVRSRGELHFVLRELAARADGRLLPQAPLSPHTGCSFLRFPFTASCRWRRAADHTVRISLLGAPLEKTRELQLIMHSYNQLWYIMVKCACYMHCMLKHCLQWAVYALGCLGLRVTVFPVTLQRNSFRLKSIFFKHIQC